MDSALAAIANFREVGPGLYAAGQPAAADWQALRAAGVRSIINLRAPSEQPDAAEPSEVAAAGMAYTAIPVADGSALGPTLVQRLDEAMRALPPPWLVHCASANRVGAALALRAAWHGGLAPEVALALGRRAGLASLEPLVRKHLGMADK